MCLNYFRALICLCFWLRSSCQTLASALRSVKISRRGSLWWGRRTGWLRRSSPNHRMERRYSWTPQHKPSDAAVTVRLNQACCAASAGGRVVSGHHGGGDGGRRASVFQWDAGGCHEASERRAGAHRTQPSSGTRKTSPVITARHTEINMYRMHSKTVNICIHLNANHIQIIINLWK